MGREKERRSFRADFSVRAANQYTLPAYNGLKDPSLRSYFTKESLKRQLVDYKLVTRGGYVLGDGHFQEREGAAHNFRRQRRLFRQADQQQQNTYMAMQCQF